MYDFQQYMIASLIVILIIDSLIEIQIYFPKRDLRSRNIHTTGTDMKIDCIIALHLDEDRHPLIQSNVKH